MDVQDYFSKQEIINVTNNGHIVIVPESEVSIGSWNGIGYIVFDPQTGSGAYRISGGLNGGEIECECFGFDPSIEAIALILIGILAGVAGTAVAALVAAIISTVFLAINAYATYCQIDKVQDPAKREQLLNTLTVAVAFTLTVIAVAAVTTGPAAFLVLSIVAMMVSGIMAFATP